MTSRPPQPPRPPRPRRASAPVADNAAWLFQPPRAWRMPRALRGVGLSFRSGPKRPPR